ncbi:MAG: hypothetical protein ABI254_04950 [Chthoniobacterales bacterium]
MHITLFLNWLRGIFTDGENNLAFVGVPDFRQGGSMGSPRQSAGDANFFGGGAPSAPKPQAIPQPPPISIPPTPAPPPPPPPLPSESKLEVQDAATQQRRDQQKRQGQAASLIAGETGGYTNKSTNSATGSGSLLG